MFNNMEIGRVIFEARASYQVQAGNAVYSASLRGHFHETKESLFPKVGDYVEITVLDAEQARIERVCERKNTLTRLHPHTGEQQVMVANVDYVFIVIGGEDDFSVRRIERYIALTLQAGVTPIIVINKADTLVDREILRAVLAENVPTITTHFVSAVTKIGLDHLVPYFNDQQTVALLGSSGAGKSSLLNVFIGEAVQATQSVREIDSRGRHTTTARQLFAVPQGGYIIDTPGMRELALFEQMDLANETFSDIAILAKQCQFRNCDHDKSAGCAILTAIAAGAVTPERLVAWRHFNNNQERVRRVRTR